MPFCSGVQGRTDAEAAIRAGKPARMTLGLPPPGEVDPQSGLPYDIQGGCIRDDTVWPYAIAYNETIDAARRQGRLAGMDLKARFLSPEEARVRLDTVGRRMAPGDPPLVSPDGRYRVWLQKPEHDVSELPHPLIVETPGGARRELESFDAPRVVAFAEGPAPTLLVRDEAVAWNLVYDLEHGFLLQMLDR